ncbi:WAT1-related protein At1g43650-like [Actinidia eriantha]|uniref:WAT1-related protein At1g43650-like n=1 Tax=Actinidia eriantha TaxID=165200 RepID=UPI002589BC1C|nr:WAT1-related protein At1g43650-like [Actinidia eriantha]
MKCSLGNLMTLMKSNKAYVGILFIQFVYAVKALFVKLAIVKGMNPYVFVFYRQAFAALSLAPFAFFLERKKSATLSLNLLCKIFFVSLGGITLSLNLDCLSLNYVSATFAVAVCTTVPAMTYIMAVILRVESISVRQWHGLAKVLGSTVSLGGALVFILVKGPAVYHQAGQKEVYVSPTEGHSKGDLLKGSLAAFSSNIVWSLWIIMQGTLVKEYPALLRLTALQTFFSCIQSAIWAAAAERNISSWKLGWDVNLLSVTYCGIIFTGITYWLRIWVIEKKGPVFLAMFTPLSLLLTALLSAILWKETLHWGSVGGGLLLVGGLYGFLWGKHKEAEAEKAEQKSLDTVEETV